MKLKEKFLGVPLYLILSLFALLIIGIIIGSFADWNISSAISNPTSLLFEYTTPLLYSWLYVAAGVLFFKALKKKQKALGIFLLVLAIVYASYELGAWMVKEFTLSFKDNIPLANGIGYLVSTTVSILESLVLVYFIKDDADPVYMLKLALLIFLVGIFSTLIGNFLKGLVSRPRFRNIVSEGSSLYFHAWWEWSPWTSVNDSTRSFPSGHMIATSLVLVIPMFHDLWKYSFKGGEYVSFGISMAIIIFVGFMRIYNGAHFLSDVCFGILITSLCCFLAYFFMFHQKEKTAEAVCN